MKAAGPVTCVLDLRVKLRQLTQQRTPDTAPNAGRSRSATSTRRLHRPLRPTRDTSAWRR